MEKKIDFGVKKNEYGWQKAVDNFWLAVTPKWFEFLNWIVLLGLFHFLSDYTKDWKIKIVYLVSNIALYFFLQSFFFNLHFEGIPFLKNKTAKRLFSLIIGAIISLGVFFFIQNIIPKIAEKV
jgi:uncharacterized membrane protein (DUF373 family)